ncbi:S-layer protein [Lactobacillus sp. S2-2]|uniref:S-layer protein n=1 Tax=Lactobacillus sp. S2-2 TaxID=2692917 RepID=UPI001F1ADBFB|nr:S-layer protein [Lactobacillus sp. S2-2]MCF6515222.1 S-layer protein [Lactobacillus sp. S2-2]
MTNNLKKSLFVGLAALSFVSVASATNASAKSYAKVTSNNTLTTDPTTRNFESTGSNALMTKAGTIKGAKTVASKATMKSLMNSKSSKNYFRAYREATTNRGSKYYKVVSMDKKYRGWIYVGGVKSANTTADATITDQVKNTKFYLNSANKNTLWDAPQYTQYKASKVALSNIDTSKGFTVDKAETKTKEGSLYYHVTANSNKNVTGWIYVGKASFANGNVAEDFGGLSTKAPSAYADENNSVNVQFVDGTNYANVSDLSNYSWVTKTAGTSKGVAVDNSKNQSYNVDGKTDLDQFNNDVKTYAKNHGYSVDDITKTTNVNYGNTVRVAVSKASTSKVSYRTTTTNRGFENLDSSAFAKAPVVNSGDVINGSVNSVITADQIKTLVNSNNNALGGDTSSNLISGNTLYSNSDTNGKYVFNDGASATNVNEDNGFSNATQDADGITKLNQGDQYHLVYKYNKAKTASYNTNVKNGQEFTIIYDKIAVKGAASNSNSTNNSTVDPTK